MIRGIIATSTRHGANGSNYSIDLHLRNPRLPGDMVVEGEADRASTRLQPDTGKHFAPTDPGRQTNVGYSHRAAARIGNVDSVALQDLAPRRALDGHLVIDNARRGGREQGAETTA